jgi:hypothetical protein
MNRNKRIKLRGKVSQEKKMKKVKEERKEIIN